MRLDASTAVLAPVVRRSAGHKQARTPAWHARPEAVELRWVALEPHANGAHFAEHPASAAGSVNPSQKTPSLQPLEYFFREN